MPPSRGTGPRQAYIDATAREQRQAARANRTYRALTQLTDTPRLG